MTTGRTWGRDWSGGQASGTGGCDRSRREILRATVELAAARGATPLILARQCGPEEPVEQALRRRILDEPGLPFVLVEIDPAWRVPGDVHPNARAAKVIAAAVVARLTQP